MSFFLPLLSVILVSAAFGWINYANYKHAKEVGYREGYHDGFHKGRLEGEGYKQVDETTWVKEDEE